LTYELQDNASIAAILHQLWVTQLFSVTYLHILRLYCAHTYGHVDLHTVVGRKFLSFFSTMTFGSVEVSDLLGRFAASFVK